MKKWKSVIWSYQQLGALTSSVPPLLRFDPSFFSVWERVRAGHLGHVQMIKVESQLIRQWNRQSIQWVQYIKHADYQRTHWQTNEKMRQLMAPPNIINCYPQTTSRDSPLPSLDYLKISGGIFHDCAVHDIDLITWILGEYPTEVCKQFQSRDFAQHIRSSRRPTQWSQRLERSTTGTTLPLWWNSQVAHWHRSSIVSELGSRRTFSFFIFKIFG